MSSSLNSKRQRHESEYSLATLSAVAAATSIAESESSAQMTSMALSDEDVVKSKIKSNTSSKRIEENQLHPMYGVQPFIAKLYQMIDSCDRDAPSIASWDDSGQTFIVKDTKAFATNIMPNYMQTKQFDSFIRNLNFYDFHKIHALPIPKSDRDPGAAKHVKYRHPNFQRNKMDLVKEIKRSTRKVRNAAAQQEKDVEQIKHKVKKLENTIDIMVSTFQMEMSRMKKEITRLESIVQAQALHVPSSKISNNFQQHSRNVGSLTRVKPINPEILIVQPCRSVSIEPTTVIPSSTSNPSPVIHEKLETSPKQDMVHTNSPQLQLKVQRPLTHNMFFVGNIPGGVKHNRKGNPMQVPTKDNSQNTGSQRFY